MIPKFKMLCWYCQKVTQAVWDEKTPEIRKCFVCGNVEKS